ncbi:MAG: PAS domain S-box protein [Alphaproteobacteria bacterium]
MITTNLVSDVDPALRAPLAEALGYAKSEKPGLSFPFVLDGQWLAVMALQRPNDVGRAVHFSIVDLQRVGGYWNRLEQSPGTSIAISTEAGRLWWRRPMLEGLVGKDVSEGPFMRGMRQQGGHRGAVYVEAVLTDGIKRLVGWEKAPQHGLIVSFSRPQAVLIKEWLSRFPVTLAIAAIMVLAAVILTVRAAALARAHSEAQTRAVRSEQRLADWARASADVFWETDADHRFSSIRNVGDSDLPIVSEEYLGRTPWGKVGIADPTSDEVWAVQFEKMEAHQPFRNFECSSSRGDGLHHVKVSGSPVFGTDGKFSGYRGVTVNIDAEKVAQKALESSQEAVVASEKMLRFVIDQLPATVSIKDTAGRMLIYNKRFANVFDLDLEGGIGKTVGETVQNAIGDAVEGRDRMVLETKRPLELERPYRGYILHLMKVPLLDDGDECLGLVTVGYDITERRKAEQQLAESERRLAHMVDLLPAGAVYVEDGSITINAATEVITGRSRDELTTLDDWFRLTPANGSEAGRAEYDAAAATGFSEAVRFPILRSDGAQRQVEWAAYRAGAREVWLLRDITESQEADDRFRALFEQSATGHLIAHENQVVECNAAVAEIFGAKSQEELLGKTIIELSPVQQADGRSSTELLRHYSIEILKNGGSRFDWTMKRFDGSDVATGIVATKISYQNGVAFLVECQDISERKAYEVELLQSREQIERERLLAVERINDTTQALSGWMWETDAEGRFVFMTDSVERLAGFKPEWHYGKTRHDLMQSGVQEGEVLLAEIQAAEGEQQAFRDFEFQRVGTDGTTRWMRTSGVPFFDEHGVFQGFRGAAFSIQYEKELEAKQKKLTREAAEARRRLEDAIEAQQSAFALYDSEDRLAACNDAYRNLTPNMTNFVKIGEPFRDVPERIAVSMGLEGAAKDAFVDKRMAEHLGEIGPVTKQFTNKRWITSEERRTADGGIVGIWTDVTALIEAREAAEAANTAKSEFLAMISHEIRTPMNAVLGMASVLLESKMAHEQRQQVATIQSSGKALLALINDVLDLSKIEAGKIELEEEEFSLTGLLDFVLDVAGERAQSKKLQLVAFVEGSLPDRLVGDSNRLQQVLLNLVSNAVKFTESGGVRVSARRVIADGYGSLRLEVMDTGIGVPRDAMSKLFQPFTQADASTTRQYGGTGLGLTISKQLIEAMGGRIGVESQPGAGSCFWIEAPIDLPAHDEAVTLDGARCLVVAPDQMGRKAVVDTVVDLGGKATAVDGAEQALAILGGLTAQRPLAAMFVSTAIGGQTARELVIASERLCPGGIGRLVIFGDEIDIAASVAAEANIVPASGSLIRSWRLFDGPHVGDRSSDEPVEEVASTEALRILLVEDNRVNQMVATAMLKLDGHGIDIAENGLEGISAVLRKDYDIILMDMQMPQMDGLDATREIRALGGRQAATPIVAMTANAMVEHRRMCMDAGMDDFLSKPIDHARLSTTIAKWTGRSKFAANSSSEKMESSTTAATPPVEENAAQALGMIVDGLDDIFASGDG